MNCIFRLKNKTTFLLNVITESKMVFHMALGIITVNTDLV
jgi:hypothetical protein